MQPAISVILTTYNRAPLLGTAIESILAQTHKDWEMIIVDDGSTDDTPAVLARYAKDPRIRSITQANKGRVGALNTAIQIAKAEFYAIQDDDDISLPDRLATCLTAMRAHPEWEALVETIGEFVIATDNIVNHLETSLFYRRSLWERLGGYRPLFISGEDSDFDWRAEEAGAQFGKISETLYIARKPHHKDIIGAAPVQHLSSAQQAAQHRLIALICRRMRRRAGVKDLVELGHDAAAIMEMIASPACGLRPLFWREAIFPPLRIYIGEQIKFIILEDVADARRLVAAEIKYFATALKNWDFPPRERAKILRNLYWISFWTRGRKLARRFRR